MRMCVTAAVLVLAGGAMADVWSPMEYYIGLGNPDQGRAQSASARWTFRRGSADGDLLTGIVGALTCEQGYGLWGRQGGEYGFIPCIGPRLSPDEDLDQGTYDYTRRFDGLMVIPGTGENAFLVFTANGPVNVPPLTLLGQMVFASTNGVLLSVKTRISGVTETWLDKAKVPPDLNTYQQWDLFGGQGPSLAKGDSLWIEVDYNGDLSGDWANISLVAGGCYADCNGDGTLDLFDFLCFVNDFNAGGVYSDCDGSEVADLFDFLCFVNIFNTGC